MRLAYTSVFRIAPEQAPLLWNHTMEGEEKSEPRRLRNAVLGQILLGLVANLGSVSPGMTLGFSAVAIPQMMSPNATFTINQDQASWMASLASLSTAAGCLVSGSLMDRFGRKLALLGPNVPGFLGWLLIAFAQGDATLSMVYAGRILTGLSTGMMSSPGPVYSAEVSNDKMRVILVTWTSVAVSLGILLVYVLGAVIQNDWRLIAGCCAILPALSFLLVLFCLPESPSWLTSRGKHEEARAIQERIHGTTQPWAKTQTQQPPSPPKPFLSVLLSAPTIKPFIIMTLYFFFQQFSGTFVVIFYAIDIVKDAGISFDPYLVTILIGVTRFLVSLLLSIASYKFGRRPPSIVSGAGMTLCMCTLATFVYLQSSNSILPETAKNLNWIPATSLVLYIFMSTVGFLTLPWAMVGEVYPTRVRGLLAGVTTCMAYVFSFVILKNFPLMVATLDKYGLFFFYGVISLLGTIFVVIFLPETKGKSIREIEEIFRGKRRNLDIEEERPLDDVKRLPVILPASIITEDNLK